MSIDTLLNRIDALRTRDDLISMLAEIPTDGSTPMHPDCDPDNYHDMAEFNIDVLNAFILAAQRVR